MKPNCGCIEDDSVNYFPLSEDVEFFVSKAHVLVYLKHVVEARYAVPYRGQIQHRPNFVCGLSFLHRGASGVRSRQRRWLGHIVRPDSLLRITLEGQIQGKKAYGRPRTMFLDWLLKMEEGNISYEELKMSAQDRSRWSQ